MYDMSYEEKEIKDFSTPKMSVPKYPHGLKLRLGPEELEKLGVKSAPGIDMKVDIQAVAKVVEVENSVEEGEDSYSVELQIVEMELKEKKESKPEAHQVIYGG